jgi:endonuclease/exonuclease/phosphatase family metal-dependent hydrolase
MGYLLDKMEVLMEKRPILAMERASTQQRREYMSRVRDTLQKRIFDLAYRLRPEHPMEGLEYISIASAARRTYFPRGVPLEIGVWNTFKGRREQYYDFLSTHTTGADLILLQEFRHDPVLEASHCEIFSERDAGMAVSFYTRPNQEAPTGVCTVSTVRAAKILFLLSRYFEPVTRTPKTAMCTYYPIEHPQCRPEQALLVLNSHGINFRLRRPFLDQMLQFEEQLRHHTGPIILVGDFNTWEKGRVRILEAVARSIGLARVRFPAGIKAVRGHELDRVYVRGGVAIHQRVLVNPEASDHSMLAFKLVLA